MNVPAARQLRSVRAQGLPVARRDDVVSGPWSLVWYRLKGYVDTRQLEAAAEAADTDDSAEAAYYRAMTAAYADIMRHMNETEAALSSQPAGPGRPLPQRLPPNPPGRR